MTSALLTKGGRRALAQIRYVTPVAPRAADGLVARVYAQVEQDFGMLAPPVALHSPAPGPLAAVWVMLRETLLVGGRASRREKELAAAAVSAANACPYCVAVHTSAMNRAARSNPSRDPDQIGRWAGSTGLPGQAPGPPSDRFAELAGVAVTFHYLNRMVSVFLPDSPLPFRVPRAMAERLTGILSAVMLSTDPVPGLSLNLLPEAPPPQEFSWAIEEPRVCSALARAAAAIAEAADQVVPSSVRELVASTLAGWDGSPPGPSRAWADAAVHGLAATDRPAGRLALLTALAPYQVGSADLAGGDAELITLTSWASMAAARKVGSWLANHPA
jgi:AhpD family alkylhydroperoxidase